MGKPVVQREAARHTEIWCVKLAGVLGEEAWLAEHELPCGCVV